MIKYEYLQEKAKELILAIREESRKAENEDEFEEIEGIITGLLINIPHEIVLLDFCPRSAMKTFLQDNYAENTEKINNFMSKNFEKESVIINDDNLSEIAKNISEDF